MQRAMCTQVSGTWVQECSFTQISSGGLGGSQDRSLLTPSVAENLFFIVRCNCDSLCGGREVVVGDVDAGSGAAGNRGRGDVDEFVFCDPLEAVTALHAADGMVVHGRCGQTEHLLCSNGLGRQQADDQSTDCTERHKR